MCAWNVNMSQGAAGNIAIAPVSGAVVISGQQGTGRPLGVSLGGVNYYTPNGPYMNLVKQMASSNNNTWWTGSSTSGDTGEEGYLQLDADGYPTSLVASPTPSGGQKFQWVECVYGLGIVTSGVPNLPYPYKSGTYRFQYTGTGSIILTGDTGTVNITATGGTSSTNVTISAPSGGGFRIRITATDPSHIGDYLRGFSFVHSSNTAAFDAGEIFTPEYLAQLSYAKVIRCMDLLCQANELIRFNATAPPQQGATSLQMQSTWTQQSGVYNIHFRSGDLRQATFTVGSATVTWTGGLSANCDLVDMYYSAKKPNWTDRPQPSNVFWNTLAGAPYEVCIALANKLGVNPWLNIGDYASDTYTTSLATLIRDNLSSQLTARIEYTNEGWNGGQTQINYLRAAGHLNFNGVTGGTYGLGPINDVDATYNFYGMRITQFAYLFDTVFGSTGTGRWAMEAGGQAANTAVLTTILDSKYWQTRDSVAAPWLRTLSDGSKAIKRVAIAPYLNGFGSGSSVQTDLNNMTSQSDGGESYIVQSMTTNVFTGGTHPGTYSSVPANGWNGLAVSWMAAHKSAMASYGNLPIDCYESGLQFVANTSGTGNDNGTPVCNMYIALARNTDMYAIQKNYLAALSAAGNGGIVNVFVDISNYDKFGVWGALENVYQTISPLNSAPPRFKALVDYASGL